MEKNNNINNNNNNNNNKYTYHFEHSFWNFYVYLHNIWINNQLIIDQISISSKNGNIWWSKTANQMPDSQYSYYMCIIKKFPSIQETFMMMKGHQLKADKK